MNELEKEFEKEKSRIPLPMIKKEDCKDGFLYFIDARNAGIGIYSKKVLGFIYSRLKFSSNFIDIEYHWDIGDVQPEMRQHGTASPLKEIGPVPKTINDKKDFSAYTCNKQVLNYLNRQWEKLKEERGKYCLSPDSEKAVVYSKQGSFIDWEKYHKDKERGLAVSFSDPKYKKPPA
jgi:hypothetical protein